MNSSRTPLSNDEHRVLMTQLAWLRGQTDLLNHHIMLDPLFVWDKALDGKISMGSAFSPWRPDEISLAPMGDRVFREGETMVASIWALSLRGRMRKLGRLRYVLCRWRPLRRRFVEPEAERNWMEAACYLSTHRHEFMAMMKEVRPWACRA